MLTYIVEIICIAAGLLFIIMGVNDYGLWKGISISGGFMPLFVGTLIILFSVALLIAKFRRKEKAEKIDPKAFIPVGAMLLILVLNWLIGLMGACVVMSLLWLRFVEKYSWKTSIITTICIFAATYGIFKLWLNVPFPTGLLGEIL